MRTYLIKPSISGLRPLRIVAADRALALDVYAGLEGYSSLDDLLRKQNLVHAQAQFSVEEVDDLSGQPKASDAPSAGSRARS